MHQNNTYVGVLLNRIWHDRLQAGGVKGHEAFMLYEQEGQRHGVKPCFVRLEDLRPGRQEVEACVFDGSRIVRKKVTMPAVIHNRAIYRSRRSRDKIDQIAASGVIVFNRHNRYGKMHIHKLLLESERLRIHLPETRLATQTNVREMMRRHSSLLIKPDSGSIGKGIMKLERTGDKLWQWRYHSEQGGKPAQTSYRSGRLPRLLVRRITGKPHIVQQRLPLAEYEGRPFDIRVSVQRDRSGNWQVTGMIGKAAARAGMFVTNVAQGGQVVSLEQLCESAPGLNADAVRSEVCRFSLDVAHHLGERLPELADLGLDIGITEAGFPMFIECNGRDLRYSFLQGGMTDAWRNTYASPMGYAAYLLEHGLQGRREIRPS